VTTLLRDQIAAAIKDGLAINSLAETK